MQVADGGPAFPDEGKQGMSLRDYFAAAAMQGMLASGITVDIDGDYMFERRAGVAYALADAMLAARRRVPAE